MCSSSLSRSSKFSLVPLSAFLYSFNFRLLDLAYSMALCRSSPSLFLSTFISESLSRSCWTSLI